MIYLTFFRAIYKFIRAQSGSGFAKLSNPGLRFAKRSHMYDMLLIRVFPQSFTELTCDNMHKIVTYTNIYYLEINITYILERDVDVLFFLSRIRQQQVEPPSTASSHAQSSL
jgi:hypothetical protein